MDVVTRPVLGATEDLAMSFSLPQPPRWRAAHGALRVLLVVEETVSILVDDRARGSLCRSASGSGSGCHVPRLLLDVEFVFGVGYIYMYMLGV